jgi:hypothetical protein
MQHVKFGLAIANQTPSLSSTDLIQLGAEAVLIGPPR